MCINYAFRPPTNVLLIQFFRTIGLFFSHSMFPKVYVELSTDYGREPEHVLLVSEASAAGSLVE